LHNEAETRYNYVPSIAFLIEVIESGRWSVVLDTLRCIDLPKSYLESLHEQIYLELVEKGDVKLCKEYLVESGPIQGMKSGDPSTVVRFRRLENLAKSYDGNPQTLYRELSREQRRANLASSIPSLVQEIKPTRLISILGDAVRWQRDQGFFEDGDGVYDLMNSTFTKDATSDVVRNINNEVKFAEGVIPECIAFHPRGTYAAIGSSDGLIEIYDSSIWKVSEELEYQRLGNFLVHENAVSAISFDKAGIHLASGDKDGNVIVWNFQTGVPVLSIPQCHPGPINGICFDPKAARFVSSSVNGTLRLHGMRSSQTLQDFPLGESCANSVSYLKTSEGIIAGMNDGYVKVFSTVSGEHLLTCVPHSAESTQTGLLPAVRSVAVSKYRDTESVVVCINSNMGYMLNSSSGDVSTVYASGVDTGDDFTYSVISPNGVHVYFFSERGNLYCFDTSSSDPKNVTPLIQSEVVCAVHHPIKAMIAVVASNGVLYILGK